MDKVAEKDHVDKLYLFRQLEVVEPIVDKYKYKLKSTLPLHRQVKSLYVHNLVLKRRLGLVKQKLIEASQSGRKKKRGKLNTRRGYYKGKYSSGGYHSSLNLCLFLINKLFLVRVVKRSKDLLHFCIIFNTGGIVKF